MALPVAAAADVSTEEKARIAPIKSPFDLPQPQRPVFSDRSFHLTNYGAVGNGTTKNTEMAKIFMKGQETRSPKKAKSNSIKPLPFKVSAALPDVAEVLSPSAVRIDGWLGARIAANEKNRLLVVDTEPLLAGYREKPGTHPWLGEHVGKWMHAATLAWDNTGDAALREKLDRVAADLIASQEPDGYLGTYVPE